MDSTACVRSIVPRGMVPGCACAAASVPVGDSGVDIETACNAGVHACGVTLGLSPETMRAAGPDYVIGAMAALTPIVLG